MTLFSKDYRRASTVSRQHVGEGGTLVSGDLREQDVTLLPSSYVPTSNNYEALAVDEANEQDSQGKTAAAAYTKSCKRKQQVIVVGDSAERHHDTHLLARYTVERSLLLARSQDLGCPRETTTTG